MKDILFSIGPFSVHGYGLMIAIGVLSAYFLAEYRAKKQKLQHESIFTLTLWALLGGAVGAKLLYYLTILPQIVANPRMLLENFGSGFVVYGGIVGGVIAGYLYCRYKKFDFLCYADLVMPSIALAQGFGRIGCFLAGCCYGNVTESPIGVVFPEGSLAPAGVALIPTQLISSALDFLLFFALLLFAKRKKAHGQVTGLYLILYSAGRFVLEFYRGDLIRGSVGELSTSQFISIFIFIAGTALFLFSPKLGRIREAKLAAMKADAAADASDGDEGGDETQADTKEAPDDKGTPDLFEPQEELKALNENDASPAKDEPQGGGEEDGKTE